MSLSQNIPVQHELVDPATLTARQREDGKSQLKRAEDVAYVLNHTGTCLFFDMTGGPPALAALATGKIRDMMAVHRGERLATEKRTFKESFGRFVENGKEWWIGEVVGDLGAVPVTILTQRLAPGFIASLNTGLTHVLGPMYRKGAEHATKEWASKHGVLEGSDEFKQHAEHVYQAEVEHLGDAAMWTVTAFPLNVLAQKTHAKLTGQEAETLSIVGGKLAGALWATSGVLTVRAMMPEKAQAWDEATSKHVIIPATKKVGSLFGIDSKLIDDAAARERGDVPKTTISGPAAPERIAQPERAVG